MRERHRQHTILHLRLDIRRLRTLRDGNGARKAAFTALLDDKAALFVLTLFGLEGLAGDSEAPFGLAELDVDVFLVEAWELEGCGDEVLRLVYMDVGSREMG